MNRKLIHFIKNFLISNFLAITSLTIIILCLFLPISTKIKIDLIVDRITFTVGENENSQDNVIKILNLIYLKSVSFQKFDKIEMDCDNLKKAKKIDMDNLCSYDEWKNFGGDTSENKGAEHSLLIAGSKNSRFDFFCLKNNSLLNPIFVKPGTKIIFKFSQENNTKEAVGLTVDIKSKENICLELEDNFIFSLKNADVENYSNLSEWEKQKKYYYKGQIKNDGNGDCKIQGQLYIILRIPANKQKEAFPNKIPIKSLDITKPDRGSETPKSAIKKGEINYLEYYLDENTKKKIENGEYVYLNKLEDFFITSMDLKKEGINVTLEGVSKKIIIRRGKIEEDCCLKLIDLILYSKYKLYYPILSFVVLWLFNKKNIILKFQNKIVVCLKKGINNVKN